MKTRYKALSPGELLTEQTAIQAGKNCHRTLDWYSDIIFLNGSSRRSPISDFLGQYASASNTDFGLTLQGMQKHLGQPIHWADMCGGLSVPLRQAAVDPNLAGLQTTSVDLLKLDIDGLDAATIKHLEEISPGCTLPAVAPKQIVGNVENIQLEDQPHAITFIEGIQYSEHPLQAIANCYNQLADYGIGVVANQDDPWSENIQYGEAYDSQHQPEDMPLPCIFNELTSHGIPYQYAAEADTYTQGRPRQLPWAVSSLVLQKKPGTLLRVVADVVQIDVDSKGYKRVAYHPPDTFDSPVKVVEA